MWETITELIITVINWSGTFTNRLRDKLYTAVVSAIVALCLAFSSVVLWNILAERSVESGWNDTVAFFFRSGSLLKAVENRHVQDYLEREGRVQNLILTLMKTELIVVPSPIRIRLALIHDGNNSLNPITALRYDITAVVASPGYTSGNSIIDSPLLTTSDFISSIIKGECDYVVPKNMTNAAFRDMMVSSNTVSFIACPIEDLQQQISGFILYEWESTLSITEVKLFIKHILPINKDIGVAIEAASTTR
jgi:hypothetical protein